MASGGKIEVGKSYHIYAKLPGRRRFRPLGGDGIVFNLIYADIFTVKTEAERQQFERYLTDLRQNNRGRFEAREVEGW